MATKLQQVTETAYGFFVVRDFLTMHVNNLEPRMFTMEHLQALKVEYDIPRWFDVTWLYELRVHYTRAYIGIGESPTTHIAVMITSWLRGMPMQIGKFDNNRVDTPVFRSVLMSIQPRLQAALHSVVTDLDTRDACAAALNLHG